MLFERHYTRDHILLHRPNNSILNINFVYEGITSPWTLRSRITPLQMPLLRSSRTKIGWRQDSFLCDEVWSKDASQVRSRLR
jgi:hypothetical protein